ncbi:MAG: HK97 family phage prohead protease [Actinobacteria bacterium]|nr:HK97 family phage prohead protease [Actinomycetota bacterium]
MSSILKPASESERPPVVESRTVRVARLADLEWRAPDGTGDGAYTFIGHAAVFGQTTTLYQGRSFAMTESVAPGAFDAVLASMPDVHLNLNHDMSRVIARTGVRGVGALELSVDQVGLRVFARLDSADPDVAALAVKMSRGLVDQMSFAFTIGGYELVTTAVDEFETDHRTITAVSNLYDVCACAQGAYPQTDASLRSLFAAYGRAGIDPAGYEPNRSPRGEGAEGRRSPEGGHVRAAHDAERARALKARHTDHTKDER